MAEQLQVTSTAFATESPIPDKYTGVGEDLSPPLSWSAAPQGTQSVAVISDDPDAPMGTWVHWVLFNLPDDTTELPEGMPTNAELPSGAIQGITDFGRSGYGGPMPPPGKPHRYFFKVYALDTMLSAGPDARKADIEKLMKDHILAQGTLMGTYQR